MPPLGSQDHQVEGVDRLDLDPADATSSGRVRRIHCLDHHPFVAGGYGIYEEGLGGPGRGPPRVGAPGMTLARSRRGSGVWPTPVRPGGRRHRGESRRRRKGSSQPTPDCSRPGRTGSSCPGRATDDHRVEDGSPRRRESGSRREDPGRLPPRREPRSVISLRLRVYALISVPALWIWIRAPSTFHSIATCD